MRGPNTAQLIFLFAIMVVGFFIMADKADEIARERDAAKRELINLKAACGFDRAALDARREIDNVAKLLNQISKEMKR